jgi:transcriptional regulator GlxA family with amidase domain
MHPTRWSRRCDGRLPIAEIAGRVGYTRRHLSERFRLATGLTPKQAARIARFEQARHLLSRPERPATARVAASCGYADQAHLSREWRTLAGCTLTTWLEEEFPFLQDDSGRGAASSSA